MIQRRIEVGRDEIIEIIERKFNVDIDKTKVRLGSKGLNALLK